jgi:threonine dehydratase
MTQKALELTRCVWQDRRTFKSFGRTMSLPVTPAQISTAANHVASYVRQTPLLDADGLGLGARVQLKLEFLQHAGSFKARGAFHSLLTGDVPKVGVAAASGGNHGAAVAYAAQRLGHAATIFVPEISSPAKIAAIRSFGADVRVGGKRYNDALDACTAFIAETGAFSVHAFDTVPTLAGQGTLAREWEMQAGADLPDTILVAVGGGGLIAGMAAWWQGRVKLVGVEPEGSRALHAALAARALVDVDVNSIAADSLGARRAGQLVYEIAAQHVAHVALVPDRYIAAAQAVLWQHLRIASEPGGAAALGALLCGAYTPKAGERVGVLLCGANVPLKALAETCGE